MVGEGAPQSPPSESSQKNRRSKIARDGVLRWCAPAGLCLVVCPLVLPAVWRARRASSRVLASAFTRRPALV
jgi:hypothetical protein